MKISRISLHGIQLNYAVLSRARTEAKSIDLPGTVVAIHSDTGLVGYGEAIALAPSYLPMLAAGTRAGIATVAPALLGANPLGINALYSFSNGRAN